MDISVYIKCFVIDFLFYVNCLDLGPLADRRCPDTHGRIPGIMFSNGQEWTEQRRFAAKSLKDFGFGTQSMEELIQVC